MMKTIKNVRMDEVKETLKALKLEFVIDQFTDRTADTYTTLFNSIFTPNERCDIKQIKKDLANKYTVLETAIRNRESLLTVIDVKNGNYNKEFGIVDSKIYTYTEVATQLRTVMGVTTNTSGHIVGYTTKNSILEFPSDDKLVKVFRNHSYFGYGKEVINNICITINCKSLEKLKYITIYKGEKYVSKSELIKMFGGSKILTKHTYGNIVIFGVKVTSIKHGRSTLCKLVDIDSIRKSIKYRYVLKSTIISKTLPYKITRRIHATIARTNNIDSVSSVSKYLAKTDIVTVQKVLKEMK